MRIEWEAEYEFAQALPDSVPNWALEDLANEFLRLRTEDVNVNLLGVPDAYPDGGWCIHQEGDIWLAYHSERRRRSRPSIFSSAFDAANYYLWIHVCSPQADNSSVGQLPRVRRITRGEIP